MNWPALIEKRYLNLADRQRAMMLSQIRQREENCSWGWYMELYERAEKIREQGQEDRRRDRCRREQWDMLLGSDD